jgi:GR25 family glycosyltransferase involved in LPS biosynthesis
MSTLNDFFSKIYCINLDRRTDRYAECLIEFKKMNIEVERFSGVDGKAINVGVGWNIGRTVGAHGLLLTHIKIIEEAIKNEYNNILILEDDVKFIDNFYEKFDNKITELPNDWDLLYLGGINYFGWGNFKMVTGDKNLIPNNENFKTLDYEICKTYWTQCAHALAINSKFYEILLKAIMEDKKYAVDTIHCILQRDGHCNAYTFLPSLAIQRPSFSDIENNNVNYLEKF